MATNLIDFWRQFHSSGPPFSHPADRALLEQYQRYVCATKMSFENFVKPVPVRNTIDRRLHLHLMPVPFLGDLDKAEIFILLLNPGFIHADYYTEENSASYRSRLAKNLLQDFDQIEFPFLSLDPEFCWHPGFGWWEGKLREVVGRIASHRYENNYIAVLRDLASRIAAIELVPYHSASFSAWPLRHQLPSALAARAYVRDVLAKDDKLIIVTRRAEDWALNESENVVVYAGGETRGASLSPASRGGRAILARYGIKP